MSGVAALSLLKLKKHILGSWDLGIFSFLAPIRFYFFLNFFQTKKMKIPRSQAPKMKKRESSRENVPRPFKILGSDQKAFSAQRAQNVPSLLLGSAGVLVRSRHFFKSGGAFPTALQKLHPGRLGSWDFQFFGSNKVLFFLIFFSKPKT